MESRVNEAIALHDKGFNCAQSVACAYCDLVDADVETVFRATEALGLGMGGTNGTCGAVSGACVVAGLVKSSANLERPDSKKETYTVSREITAQFIEKNSCLACRELKGLDTSKVLRSCPGCIEDACVILERVLFREN